MNKFITPRNVDYSQWYLDIIEHTISRKFCSKWMYGNKTLWLCIMGKIQATLDKMFKIRAY